jgi:hypothetical protein
MAVSRLLPLRRLARSTDERGRPGRKIVQQRRVAQRLQRRELGPQAGPAELENLLRAARVLEPVRSQIAQRRARRQRVADQRGRRLRHQ